ncbi:DUF732 domain-containing protein [Mycobacterium sp. 1274761.0]|uniref:DUF732 domain-containing protein n=1 Tax=Mycobacterium sp. 1274761.0 TaxID=1834077 RepID=UPI0007FC1507|nr:DUF732 domain-containing protein [Mycobacterium sp. 1274761.0]OBK77232.1 hypothetical protein A5651_04450 [Mycobacterium sp. 1274761.0]
MKRLFTVSTAALVAAGLALAAPAQADDDTAFLDALNRAGIGYADNNPDLTAQLGERVCPMLVEPGKDFAQVATTVADNGINPGLASFFTGIAIQMYCPQMMGSIGNGTFLQMVQDNNSLPGIPGLPGIVGR